MIKNINCLHPFIESFLRILFAVAILCLLLLTGCGGDDEKDKKSTPVNGDSSLGLCEQACQRIYECDKSEGNLNETFLDSCLAQCEKAEQINEEIAECLANSNCNSIDNCATSFGN